MKLSVSNIIWTKGEESFGEFLARAKGQGASMVELALSCLWEEPVLASVSHLSRIRERLDKHGLEVSALHSLTYSRPDLELFSSGKKRRELIDYLKRYFDLCRFFRTEHIVFGSPKCRRGNGLQKRAMDEIFARFAEEIDAAADGICFNIEPLPVKHCEYLNTFTEAVSLLSRLDLKHTSIQLDVRSIIDSEENLEEIFYHPQWIRHCHVGNPGFQAPGPPYEETHREVARYLKGMKYSGCITAEVLTPQSLCHKGYMLDCIKGLKAFYG